MPGGSSGGKIIRGSTELRLTSDGKEQIAALNRELKKRGVCFWRVYYSTQMRAAESAHILTSGCTSTSFMAPVAALESWHLGSYEGKPVKDVLADIQSLVAERPWVVPAGMGPNSTKPGESFNAFKTRVLDEIRRLMALAEEHPGKRIAVITHFHDIQLIDAWISKYKGRPQVGDDLYDAKVYNNEIGYPGEVCYLRKQTNGEWVFKRIKLEKYPVLPIGPILYFIRHGATSAN